MESLFSIVFWVVTYLVISSICYIFIPAGGECYREVLGFNPTTFIEAIEEQPSRRLRITLRILVLAIAPVFAAIAFVMFFPIGAVKLIWWLIRNGVKALTA